MRLLSIGAFARATRLTPKALRLYDELGLLPPALVDPASGYRFYDPAQLERAQLVAWLRRLGMPLPSAGWRQPSSQGWAPRPRPAGRRGSAPSAQGAG